jgi:hypothetical protein
MSREFDAREPARTLGRLHERAFDYCNRIGTELPSSPGMTQRRRQLDADCQRLAELQKPFVRAAMAAGVPYDSAQRAYNAAFRAGSILLRAPARAEFLGSGAKLCDENFWDDEVFIPATDAIRQLAEIADVIETERATNQRRDLKGSDRASPPEVISMTAKRIAFMWDRTKAIGRIPTDQDVADAGLGHRVTVNNDEEYQAAKKMYKKMRLSLTIPKGHKPKGGDIEAESN